MAKGLSAQEIADKWQANAAGAAANYVKGTSKVASSPMAKAANNLQKAKQNYSAVIDNGTMAAKLNAVTNESWKASCAGKGQSNYPTGINAGKPKMVAAQIKWTPIRNSIAAQVQAMPNMTFQDRINRMVTQATSMHAAKSGS